MQELRNLIFKEAHEYQTRELAIKYFLGCGLDVLKVTIEDVEKLRDFINKEIYILLADDSYSMVKDLHVKKKIKKYKFGIKLFVDGSYFKNREAISFYKDRVIGFCGWASGCNRIPFIKGFVEWCDWMKNIVKELEG